MTLTNSLVKRGMGLIEYWNRNHQAAIIQQEYQLSQLLKQAQFTDFGKIHQFSAIQNNSDLVGAFQSKVPLHNYQEMFDPWWQRSFEGEGDIHWKGQTKYFALSSGTSDAASKYIPITADMTRSMRSGALRMFSCLPKYQLDSKLYFKDWLMIGGSASLQNYGHCLAGDLSGINARKPPVWLKRLYKPGTEIARIKDWDKRMEMIAKNAPNWDIAIMTGIPSWVQLTLEYVVDFYGLDHIHQLWPNLSVFVSGGIAFDPYRKSLERLFDKKVIYQDTYLASEGFFAYQARPETNAMQLILNNGVFYEFVPFKEENFNELGEVLPHATALTIDQVEEGVDYALIISTCAGAWRYLIGDTVKFVNKELSEIVITGRTKHFLSICGEHLSVDNMNQAIKLVEENMQVEVREFTVSGVKSGSHFAHKWYLGVDGIVDKFTLGQVLDQQLQVVNDDYKAERSAMLQNLQLEIIPTKVFYDWQRHLGKMNGQSKFPRVMKAHQFEEWEKFVSQKMQIL
jgi:hypothetical protein